MASRATSRLNLPTLAAGALVVVGVVGVLRGRAPPAAPSQSCDALMDEHCTGEPDRPGARAAGGGEFAVAASAPAAVTLRASEACHNVGYLCAELERSPSIRLQRWTGFDGTIVVHVPRPDFESPADAMALQQAAAIGLRAWNGQPFVILTDTRGDREAHFEVRWARSLGGSQLGVARSQWSPREGLSVISIELATRDPTDEGRIIDSRQVRLTAAHEMGHALGLPHSDGSRDVMYPTNTATSLSARDYRTMESLYALPDGAEILR